MSLPIRSHIAWILGHASLSHVTKFLSLQVLLAEANLGLLTIRRASHHIMLNSLHASWRWTLRRVHMAGWATKVLLSWG